MDSTNEYYRMLNALSKIYISIYTFDLKKDMEKRVEIRNENESS